MRERWFVVFALLLSMGMAACQTVQAMSTNDANTAGAAADAQQCSLATLKGRYLFAHAGPVLPPMFGVAESTPGADAGFHIYNGDGTGTDIVTVRLNGEIVLDTVTVPTSYTINPDCTGTHSVLIEDGPTFDIYVAPNGEALAFIATDPGNYPSAIDIRVGSK
jgi:hypothetical protein